MDKPKTKERQEMDTTKSDKIAQDYLQKEPKLKRKVHKFSGTWKTTPEEFFPLLCPSREMDWMPGWACELIYTQSGYAEDKVIFKTDQSCIAGEGIWAFTGYEKNKYVKVVHFGNNYMMHLHLTVTDNKDGTVTGKWDIVFTALNEEGNKVVSKRAGEHKKMAAALPRMINHYLTKGKSISKATLVMEIVYASIKRALERKREVEE